MVDSIKGLGQVSNVTSISKSPKQQSDESPEVAVLPEDKVEISAEALTLSQAEEKAGQTRELLKNSDFSLGLNPNFDKKV